MTHKVYAAGHCLTVGSQMQRASEAEDLRAIGCELFNPMEADHNDKTKHKDEPLAERIVANDTAAINWSDVVVIEPLPEALGTHVELGQVLGMRDVAQEIDAILPKPGWNYIPSELVSRIQEIVDKHLNRKVYPHYEDIRRVDGITETGDRRSLAINQYVYGACLKLSGGKGFYSWDEIKQELKDG